MDLHQKRASNRIESDLPVTVVDTAGTEMPTIIGAARNISLGGINFESDIPLRIGQRVTLQLSTLKGIVELDAIVLRKTEHGFACEFVDTDLHSAKLLAAVFFPSVEP
jgi:hypothetical protein